MLATINFTPYVSSNKSQSSSVQDRHDVSFGIANRTVSVYFRSTLDRNFYKVENAILNKARQTKRPKVLVVGVGKSQEPASYIAILLEEYMRGRNQKINSGTIDSLLDLYCVDLESKVSNQELEKYSIAECPRERTLMYAPNGFTETSDGKLKIIPEITDYLRKTFNNPQKAFWNKTIQDFSREYLFNAYRKPDSDFGYDIISMNHVLMYLSNYKEKVDTCLKVLKMLKPSGILITDPSFKIVPPENIRNISPGIWQRVE